MEMSFYELIKPRWQRGLFLSVGLDTVYERIPDFIKIKKRTSVGAAVFRFNKKIIEATNTFVCGYKINSAFYERWGKEGVLVLKKTIDYIKKKHPEVFVIVDAKRGDIGNTNRAYAEFIFNYLGADAVTVNPYLGYDSLEPFLKRKDKGIFVLCKTSSSGAGEFQDLRVEHMRLGKIPLYQAVAYNVSNLWNKNNNCGLVVGATYPEDLAKIREIASDLPILIPGIGFQGGNLKKTVECGLDANGEGIIINSSRAIIYASSGTDFTKKAGKETKILAGRVKTIIRKKDE